MRPRRAYPEDWTLRGDKRAVSVSVTHALALGITAVLIAGLFVAGTTLFNGQRDLAAREQLQTIGNRLADDVERASRLAADGGDVNITTSHQRQVGGEPYTVRYRSGSDCDRDGITADQCLVLELVDGNAAVTVPVKNATDVTISAVSAGTFRIVSDADGSTEPTDLAVNMDLRIGVGEDIGFYGGNASLNLANRPPIAGFTFTPGQPTVDDVIHFENDTKDLDGIITKYEWDLDNDGTIDETGPEFNHSFSSPGRYTVEMIVTDDDGEKDNVSKVVVVGGLVYNHDAKAVDISGSVPGGGVTYSVTNKHSDVVKVLEVFINPDDDSIDWLNETVGGVYEIEIQGDVNTGGHNTEFRIFDDGRIFQVDDQGDYNNGDIELSSGSTANASFYGFSQDEARPRINMSGKVTFVSLRYEVSGTFYTTGFHLFGGPPANEPPDPAFTYTCSGRNCSFDATGSSDDGSITSYDWDFDDGNTSTGATPSNTFPANSTYDVSLTVTDDSGVTSTLTKSVNVGDLGGSVVVWAVNSGGNDYTATDGTEYVADTDYTDGSTATTSDSIANTSEDTLYQSERYGDWGYDVSVANGDYRVTFHLAEIYWSNDGDRQFDVSLEGSEVITDLDIHSQVGHDYSYDLTRDVTVSDGNLDIDFSTDVDNAKSSAIKVEQLDPDAFQESSGEVVMEAENYMSSEPGNNDDDGPSDGDDMGDAPHVWTEYSDGDASNGTALEARPTGWGYNAQDTENGERLDYYVDFTTTGTYYVWARMECPSGGSDSVHAGLNGTVQSYGDTGLTEGCGTSWTWVQNADGNPVTVDISSSGTHTVNIWMREDGTRIDKVVLTTDSGYTPSGTGPAESPIS